MERLERSKMGARWVHHSFVNETKMLMKKKRYETDRANLVERASSQCSRSNNPAYSKTRKKSSQAYEGDENIREWASKRKSRTLTIPVAPQTPDLRPRHRASISFTNESEIMINENIGNTYNITTPE